MLKSAEAWFCVFSPTGIAASFAVKLFKAWMAEKDANSVTSALRKANLDKRLLVSTTYFQQEGNKMQMVVCCKPVNSPSDWLKFFKYFESQQYCYGCSIDTGSGILNTTCFYILSLFFL